jgi:C-terminal processing protease CtpA/Prc
VEDTGAEAAAFAASLPGIVATLDTNETCGWIVDLRHNIGGNMWPMIAGIGPVLGEGDVGGFLDADSAITMWYYAYGAAGVRAPSGEQRVLTQLSREPYRLASPGAPVAVLYGPVTASSGEALAVAFRGRPLARSFGQPTAGLSTANSTYRMSDGALLVITNAIDVDRDGDVYGKQLEPDQNVLWGAVDPLTPYDTAAARAKDWVLDQSACAGVGR